MEATILLKSFKENSCQQKVEKNTLKSCSENLKSTFFPYCPELPKQKNSCSKLWLIDRLYIELGFFPLPFYSDEILWRFYFWVYWLDRNVSLFLRCVNFEINEFVSMFIAILRYMWFFCYSRNLTLAHYILYSAHVMYRLDPCNTKLVTI